MLVHQTADTSLLVPVAGCFMEGSPQSPPYGLHLLSPTSLYSDRCFVLPVFPSDDQIGWSLLFIFPHCFLQTPRPMLSSNILASDDKNIEMFNLPAPPTLTLTLEFSIKVGSADPNLNLQSRLLTQTLIYLVSPHFRATVLQDLQ